MLEDKMRLSAVYIKGEEGMQEAKDLKDIEWHEFFIACDILGRRYFDMGDYENAIIALEKNGFNREAQAVKNIAKGGD